MNKFIKRLLPTKPWYRCHGCDKDVHHTKAVFTVDTLKPYHYECLKKQRTRKKWYKERRRYYD